MQYTGNLQLKKPDGTDAVNIDDLNYNADKIDTEIVKKASTTLDGRMSKEDKSKLDGIATGAEVNQNSFTNVKVGTTTITADSKTDTLELVAGTNISLTADTTNDKVTINNTYTHPATHPASIITQDTSNRFVTDTEKATWNAKLTATSYTATDVLAKLITVDGSGCGLDADTVDGVHAIDIAKTRAITPTELNATTLQAGIYTNNGQGLLNNAGATVLEGWFHVYVSQHKDLNGYGGQIAQCFSSANSQNIGKLYSRTALGTTWSDWKEIGGDRVLLAQLVPTEVNAITLSGLPFETYKYFEIVVDNITSNQDGKLVIGTEGGYVNSGMFVRADYEYQANVPNIIGGHGQWRIGVTSSNDKTKYRLHVTQLIGVSGVYTYQYPDTTRTGNTFSIILAMLTGSHTFRARGTISVYGIK
jgi:hypothetical protein